MASGTCYSQRGINWDIAPWELRFHRPVFRCRQRLSGPTRRGAGVLFLLLAAVVAYAAWRNGILNRLVLNDYSNTDIDDVLRVLWRALLVLGFAGLVWRLILLARVKYELAIGETEVLFTVKSFGVLRAQWTEPLASYDGVLFRVVEGPSAFRAKPELYHADPDKRLLLCDVEMLADDPAGRLFRPTWKGYANALRVPAIEEAPSVGSPLSSA